MATRTSSAPVPRGVGAVGQPEEATHQIVHAGLDLPGDLPVHAHRQAEGIADVVGLAVAARSRGAAAMDLRDPSQNALAVRGGLRLWLRPHQPDELLQGERLLGHVRSDTQYL